MKQFLYLFLSIWVLLLACNDPILIGSELLTEEQLGVDFTDNLAVTAKTITGEPSITFRQLSGSSYAAQTYMVGATDDAAFGKSESVTYFSPAIVRSYPSFSTHPIDSVVMTLPLDSLGFYGDLEAIHNIELRAITQSLETNIDADPVDTLLSNEMVEVESEIWASASKVITYKDSTLVSTYDDELDTMINLAPELRLKLNKLFWTDLAGTVLDTLTQDEFELAVPGFELRSVDAENSMFAVNLAYNANTFSSPANINIYYRQDDSIKIVYRMPLGRYRHSEFTNDYTGSELQASIDDPTSSDLLYIQSQAGTSIEVDLSEVINVEDKILNYGELQMTVMPEDEDLFQPAVAIVPWYRNEDGRLVEVGGSATDPPLYETYSAGTRSLRYTLDLTLHLNQIKSGAITNSKIILIPVSKAQRPHRSIILGPDHPVDPMKLNLILTKP